MCGIVGAWSFHGDPPQIDAMVATLNHRGPDDRGTWSDPRSGVALGHTRLAVIDLTAAGHQPMESHDGRYVFVFNGEIYNHHEIRGALERGDGTPTWRGESDTETLLTAITRWGVEAALQHAVGMFAFALWDRRDRQLVLARDRFGEKPLYYGVQRGTLLCASELQALRKHPRFDATIDRTALTAYMRYSCVPTPQSIFTGIRKVPPGTYLTFTADTAPETVEPVPYWSLTETAEQSLAQPFSGSDEEAVDQLEELLHRTLTDQRVADVPVGAFLSGGIDSTVIVALLQKISSRPVRTFTIGIDDWRYDESAHARTVAEHLGTDHTELRITETDMLQTVARLGTIYDEPFADSSQIPTSLISALTRKHVTVSLSGDGGDEVFGGYNRYVWPKRTQSIPFPLRAVLGRGLAAVSPGSWNAVYRAFLPLISPSRRMTMPGDRIHKLADVLRQRDLPAIYRLVTSQWNDPASLVTDGWEAADNDELWSRADSVSDPVDRMMLLDALTYLTDDILTKVDRAAMNVSLETRVPFLDHRIVSFAWSLPQAMKIRGGTTKWILRELLHRSVPREIMERPKSGFAVPIGEWLRGPLHGWAETLIDRDRLQAEGYLNAEPVRSVWDEHLAGTRNHAGKLWNVLMFQQWLEANG